ncbi:MAG TPA: branched-chain amino acid ABC transporter permease [Acidimicrobiia bacterium]|jgi:branched-chain amino acid transport system permease protein|nr:branched-chain amino acid ABC transporter permease [Acidimicrobiia bacterium]
MAVVEEREGLLGESPFRKPGTRSRRVTLIAALGLVLFFPLIAIPLFDSYAYVLQVGMLMLMWIAMSSSWNIIGGFAGYISLGHGVFFAIGGYAAGLALAHWGISPFLFLPFAGLAAMAVGFLAGLITLRTRGPAFIVATIAMLFLFLLWFDNWEFIGASSGLDLPFLQFPVQWLKVPFYYAMALCAIGAVYLAYRVAHSKFGLGLRAISQDETKAEVAGINTRWYKVWAFALSAFFIGVAGAIYGYSLTHLRPLTFFAIAVAARMVLMAIIGGRGTVAGPVVGAILIIGVNEFAVRQFGESELNIVFTGLILVLALLFFPQGIVGSLRKSGRLPAFLDWD